MTNSQTFFWWKYFVNVRDQRFCNSSFDDHVRLLISLKMDITVAESGFVGRPTQTNVWGVGIPARASPDRAGFRGARVQGGEFRFCDQTFQNATKTHSVATKSPDRWPKSTELRPKVPTGDQEAKFCDQKFRKGFHVHFATKTFNKCDQNVKKNPTFIFATNAFKKDFMLFFRPKRSKHATKKSDFTTTISKREPRSFSFGTKAFSDDTKNLKRGT